MEIEGSEDVDWPGVGDGSGEEVFLKARRVWRFGDLAVWRKEERFVVCGLRKFQLRGKKFWLLGRRGRKIGRLD